MRPYEGSFVCLLDFYVHYSLQRKGIGSRLFEFMLENEHVSGAHQIPLDKPSATLLAFMAKHYGLNDPIWQSTNFVVFPPIFSADKSIGQSKFWCRIIIEFEEYTEKLRFYKEFLVEENILYW